MKPAGKSPGFVSKAALALHDVTPQNHRGLSNLFGLHIVKPGLVERRWSSVIGQLSDRRLDADYNVAVIFSEADAARAFDQADSFNNRSIPCSPIQSPPDASGSDVAEAGGIETTAVIHCRLHYFRKCLARAPASNSSRRMGGLPVSTRPALRRGRAPVAHLHCPL